MDGATWRERCLESIEEAKRRADSMTFFAQRETIGGLSLLVALAPAPLIIVASILFLFYMHKPATIYVPEATTVGIVETAAFDPSYCQGLGANFVVNYGNWTRLNYNFRISKAVYLADENLKNYLLSEARAYKAKAVEPMNLSRVSKIKEARILWTGTDEKACVIQYLIERQDYYGVIKKDESEQGVYTLDIQWISPTATNPYCAQVTKVHYAPFKKDK
jgi:hypothetical protein